MRDGIAAGFQALEDWGSAAAREDETRMWRVERHSGEPVLVELRTFGPNGQDFIGRDNDAAVAIAEALTKAAIHA